MSYPVLPNNRLEGGAGTAVVDKTERYADFDQRLGPSSYAKGVTTYFHPLGSSLLPSMLVELLAG